ncbi:unnamed protein product [Umbelopsis sp. WA50703]
MENSFEPDFVDHVLYGDDHPQDSLHFSHGKNSSDSSPSSQFETEWESHMLSRNSLARLENIAQTPAMAKTSYIPPSQRNLLNSPLDLDMSLCDTPQSFWETPMESPMTMYSATPYIPPTPFYTPMVNGQDVALDHCDAIGKSPFIADEGYYTNHMSPYPAGFDGNPLSLITDKDSILGREPNHQIVYVGEQTSHIDSNSNSLFVPLDDCMSGNDDNGAGSQPSSQTCLFDVVDEQEIFGSQNEESASANREDDDYTPFRVTIKRKRTSSTRDVTGRPLKRFECPHGGCPMKFSRRFNLQTHMRVHDPERQKKFRCDVDGCNKNFDRRHDLSRHEATVHRGERAYHCEYCEKPFSRKDALVRHVTVKGCPNQPLATM